MPQKIAKLIAEAEIDRKEDFKDAEKEEFIEMKDEIYKLIKLTPVFNSNTGFIKPFFLFYLLH